MLLIAAPVVNAVWVAAEDTPEGELTPVKPPEEEQSPETPAEQPDGDAQEEAPNDGLTHLCAAL